MDRMRNVTVDDILGRSLRGPGPCPRQLHRRPFGGLVTSADRKVPAQALSKTYGSPSEERIRMVVEVVNWPQFS